MSLANNEQTVEFNYLNVSIGQCETISINKNVVSNLELTQIYESLNQIKFTYLSNGYLIDSKCLEHARFLLNDLSITNSSPPERQCLFVSALNTNRFLLKPDWIYMPILTELIKHERAMKTKSVETVDKTQTQLLFKLTSTVVSTLKFVYLMEMYFGSSYLDLHLSFTLRYSRLLCVYLFEPELFLDKQIVTYMYLIYLKFAKDDKKRIFEKLDLKEKLDGILSFYDFYQHLLSHYDAVSFGDYLFSLYLIVPLQLRYPIQYRQLFWSDFPHLFKFMRFENEASRLLLPLSNFVLPNEKNLHMLRLYSQVLLDPNEFQLISKSKLGYGILIVSLNSFIFEHINKVEHKVEFDFKKLLVTQFLSLNNQVF